MKSQFTVGFRIGSNGFLHSTLFIGFQFMHFWKGGALVRHGALPPPVDCKFEEKIGRGPKIFKNRLFLCCFLLADFAKLLCCFGQRIAQETSKFGDLSVIIFRFDFISSKFSSSLHVLTC
jgi:hypothetical protein